MNVYIYLQLQIFFNSRIHTVLQIVHTCIQVHKTPVLPQWMGKHHPRPQMMPHESKISLVSFTKKHKILLALQPQNSINSYPEGVEDYQMLTRETFGTRVSLSESRPGYRTFYEGRRKI